MDADVNAPKQDVRGQRDIISPCEVQKKRPQGQSERHDTLEGRLRHDDQSNEQDGEGTFDPSC